MNTWNTRIFFTTNHTYLQILGIFDGLFVDLQPLYTQWINEHILESCFNFSPLSCTGNQQWPSWAFPSRCYCSSLLNVQDFSLDVGRSWAILLWGQGSLFGSAFSDVSCILAAQKITQKYFQLFIDNYVWLKRYTCI